jgi:hypothetical protein
MFALYILVIVGSMEHGWSQTITNVGSFKDKATCHAAAKDVAFTQEAGPNLQPKGLGATALPGGQPPIYICAPSGL